MFLLQILPTAKYKNTVSTKQELFFFFTLTILCGGVSHSLTFGGGIVLAYKYYSLPLTCCDA